MTRTHAGFVAETACASNATGLEHIRACHYRVMIVKATESAAAVTEPAANEIGRAMSLNSRLTFKR